ncbi:hypothetical protein [Methylobacterium sp. J-077]|uniref:hypothetical protein n=1 Tax=Methylobacterium sp. J-077 TaxID=2836656 RepID=UPI001FB8B285|nr:hypothetical protein [Methylobacterium sp. J-077]MCJ2123839.1 hypothetical protein [Methylobacterium sp. J-077]
MRPVIAAGALPFRTGLSMIAGLAEPPAGQGRIHADSACGRTAKLYLSRHPGVGAPEAATAGLTERHRAERGHTVRVGEDESALRDLIVEVPGDPGLAARQAARAGAGRD